MAEILSQDEIDALLRAISTGEVDAEDVKPERDERPVKVYDFKRPGKFSKDHMRTLTMMHESYARFTSTALSAQLRTMVHFHVVSVDQLTYEEFMRSLPIPSTLAIIDMAPLVGRFLIEIDPSLTFAMIDRLFGGPGDFSSKVNRELTEIELSVMEGIILQIIGNLKDAWSGIIELKPKLVNIESNPQFAQIVPPNEMCILLTFETKIGNVEGMSNICIPHMVIEPILSKLSAQHFFSTIRKGSAVGNLAILKQRLEQIKVGVSIEVGKAVLTVRDVLQMQVGDVIKLNRKVKDSLLGRVGNKYKFKCHPGTVGSKMAVQIDEILDEEGSEFVE
ncbi:MAG: flagellar motor switch protein FliM [bacterium]